MVRTASRPIPAGLISPEFALSFGIILSSFGLYILWSGTNTWAALLTFVTLVVYLLLYTPMKKRSPYATEVGAVSGALPPLIGWVSAEGAPTAYGWILFGILFTWQLSTLWPLHGIFVRIILKVVSNFINWATPMAKLLPEKVWFIPFYLPFLFSHPTLSQSSKHSPAPSTLPLLFFSLFIYCFQQFVFLHPRIAIILPKSSFSLLSFTCPCFLPL